MSRGIDETVRGGFASTTSSRPESRPEVQSTSAATGRARARGCGADCCGRRGGEAAGNCGALRERTQLQQRIAGAPATVGVAAAQRDEQPAELASHECRAVSDRHLRCLRAGAQPPPAAAAAAAAAVSTGSTAAAVAVRRAERGEA